MKTLFYLKIEFCEGKIEQEIKKKKFEGEDQTNNRSLLLEF